MGMVEIGYSIVDGIPTARHRERGDRPARRPCLRRSARRDGTSIRFETHRRRPSCDRSAVLLLGAVRPQHPTPRGLDRRERSSPSARVCALSTPDIGRHGAMPCCEPASDSGADRCFTISTATGAGHIAMTRIGDSSTAAQPDGATGGMGLPVALPALRPAADRTCGAYPMATVLGRFRLDAVPRSSTSSSPRPVDRLEARSPTVCSATVRPDTIANSRKARVSATFRPD